jgi:hypothetical protein
MKVIEAVANAVSVAYPTQRKMALDCAPRPLLVCRERTTRFPVLESPE